MKWWIGLLAVAACKSKAAPPPAPSSDRDGSIIARPDASDARFVRIPITIVDRLHADGIRIGRDRPRGEIVGNVETLGTFACRLTARFGEPDRDFRVDPTLPRAHGYALRHVATGTLVIPFLGAGLDWGYGSGVVLRDDGTYAHDPDWKFHPPSFDAAAGELDDLLAATAPVDCKVEYAGGLLANRVGVTGGKAFFEHLGTLEHLDFRMAELDDFDARGGKPALEVELCRLAVNAWRNARDAKDDLSSQARVRDRLRRCVERELGELEAWVEPEWFDDGGFPDWIDSVVADAGAVELTAIEARIAHVRKRWKQLRARR